MKNIIKIMVIAGVLLGVAMADPVRAQMPADEGPSVTFDDVNSLQPDLQAELGIDPEKYKGLAPEQVLLLSVQEQMRVELQRLENLDPHLPTLFFNQQQYALLRAAMEGFEQNLDLSSLRTGQSANELFDKLPDDSDPFAGLREIVLDGIFYKGSNDWVVWLNNQRLTPSRLPGLVQNINVQKNHIDVRWYDAETKEVVPIRLRPNQRFNLDTRGFLPG